MDKKQLETLRQAIGDRATWFHLLIEEMKKRGYDYEGVAKDAIFQFGCLKGQIFKPFDTMEGFVGEFANETVREIFEMKIKEIADDQAVIEFNFCPLVDTWQKKHGLEVPNTDLLCDLAVAGDHGVMDNFSDIELNVEKRIGAGDDCCKLVFVKK